MHYRVKDCLALRYAYYVLNETLVPDAVYDRLEAYCKDNKFSGYEELEKVGSDRKESYPLWVVEWYRNLYGRAGRLSDEFSGTDYLEVLEEKNVRGLDTEGFLESMGLWEARNGYK